MQRDNEAFAGAVRIKVVVAFLDSDKPKPDLRKDPFQIGSSLDVVTVSYTNLISPSGPIKFFRVISK